MCTLLGALLLLLCGSAAIFNLSPWKEFNSVSLADSVIPGALFCWQGVLITPSQTLKCMCNLNALLVPVFLASALAPAQQHSPGHCL